MRNILNYVVVDTAETIGERNLMLAHRPCYEYSEGVRGSQKGITVTCLSEAMDFEKIDIKVNGIKELPFKFNGSPIPVEFENLQGKLWQDWSNKGEIRFSITADNVKLATTNNMNIRLGGQKA